MRTLALLFAVIPAMVACSAPADETGGRIGSTSSAVQGGKLDQSANHTFAVGIANRFGGVCTGTLIAPNLVLTARHCVVPQDGNSAVTCKDKFPKAIGAENLFVTTEANLLNAKNYYRAKEIITPTETGFCGNDIALVILTESIPDGEAKPATPVVQFPMTDKSKIGSAITALGYGITSPNANDSGVRRIREKIDILCIPGDAEIDCKGQLQGIADSTAEFVTEGYVCSGDSGGGAFDQASFTAGAPYVLGTLSRGPQTEDRCLAAIYTRTDAHAELIVAAGKKAAQIGSYDAPSWTQPLSAPTDDVECEGETCTETNATEPAPTTTTVTTTGCSAAPASSANNSAPFFLAVAALGLVAARRRRRA